MFFIILFIVIIVVAIATPVHMAQDNKRLEEMDTLLNEFIARKFSSDEEKETERKHLMKKLLLLKSQIQSSKQVIQNAEDKITVAKM
jgi:hypothetical protein